MAFHNDAIFPTDISYGSRGGAGFSTQITTLDSGQEIRSQRWSQARHRYDASYGVRTLTDLKTVLEFYHARGGSANGFRWLDHMDYSTDSTRRGTPAWNDQNLGTLAGSARTIQMRTSYTSGGVTSYRTIEKPIASSVKVGWGGAEKTLSTHYTFDEDTGVITLTSAGHTDLSGGSVYFGCQFHVPARFGEGADDLLDISVDAFETGSISSIPIVEVKQATPSSYDYNFGGITTYTTTGSSQVFEHSHSKARVINVVTNSSHSSCVLTLPKVETGMPSGGVYFYVLNRGSGSISVQQYSYSSSYTTTATINTITAGKGSMYFYGIDPMASDNLQYIVWGG